MSLAAKRSSDAKEQQENCFQPCSIRTDNKSTAHKIRFLCLGKLDEIPQEISRFEILLFRTDSCSIN